MSLYYVVTTKQNGPARTQDPAGAFGHMLRHRKKCMSFGEKDKKMHLYELNL